MHVQVAGLGRQVEQVQMDFKYEEQRGNEYHFYISRVTRYSSSVFVHVLTP